MKIFGLGMFFKKLAVFVCVAWWSVCAACVSKAQAFDQQSKLIEELVSLAHHGDADAAIALARRYEFGIDVPIDNKMAAQFYCQAALQGRPEASRRLAVMFFEGEGVQKDQVLADKWLEFGSPSRSLRRGQETTCSRGPASALDLPQERWRRGPPPQDLVQLVRRMALRVRIDPRLALAMVAAESGFQIHAVSHRGAEGLMQLMPATARELGVQNSFDPEQNILGGLEYMKRLLERYRGDENLALAAYNAGMSTVDRLGGIPGFDETQSYVQRVLTLRAQMAP